MNGPLVSIIIPVYNTEEFLGKCLDSVMEQTYGNWECICVNDGSPDNSAAILEEYGRKDARFKLVNKENGGLSSARNAGMEQMKGEYFIFLDSDDFIHPQTLEISVYHALRDSSDLVIYKRSGSYIRRTRKLLSWGITPWKPFFTKYRKERVKSIRTDNIYQYVTDVNHGRLEAVKRKYIVRHCSVCCSLFKTSVYKDLSFIQGIWYEDIPWWGAALLRTETATINNLNMYYYYPNPNSYTRNSEYNRKRAANLEKSIGYAEKVYEDAGTPYQKMIWQTRFITPLKEKAGRWRNLL